MGWFSFSNSNKSAQNVPEQTHEHRALLWLETSSEEVYNQTLMTMKAVIPTLNNYRNEHDRQMALAVAASFLTKLSTIDRASLTSKQKESLAKIIFITYPAIVAQMQTELIDIDGDREFAVVEFRENLVSLLRDEVDCLPFKIPIPIPDTKVAKKSDAPETLGTKEADEKLARVTNFAEDAYKSAANIDDRFFAEQTINSYLPDSVRFLKGLTNAPDDMKAEAFELFIRQLDAMELQLKAILGRSLQGSLSQMKAHTEFLESKKESLELK